ncbi:hypothetical protein [Paenibacillus thalictri]|uniref:Uncharacterized protein n=1 Tax=Paenibacillus thalictri TaxID=2527873 RepID=A0A4Q9DMW0_9BACL|nr:hypothetical protein [Paenibacillus thalictri]TBL74528.1 hypothetical protein EYB31_24695 [Paenibacillus thalictri]
MRYELVHLLNHVEDEQMIAAMIHNLSLDDIETLIIHLDYASFEARERWLGLFTLETTAPKSKKEPDS